MDATHDTPAERDAKADEVQRIAAETAAVLARELRRFRWEVRLGYALAVGISLIGVST